VYGIDAYVVEVEVDVGSARMQDFNVVGLPDNAVKESRERFKSVLRNCSFEFPHGQSVTINLAPADVRKEGSAFDFADGAGSGWLHGSFFRQATRQVHVPGLSLDGSVRSIRGALSATIAARDVGSKAIAVPESNAREAAVVEGVDVFAVKSLPQAIDLINSPESFHPVRVDPRLMLSEAAQYAVDMRDVHGQQAAKRAPWRYPALAGTTSCSLVLRAPARPCWPSAFRRSCRRCRLMKPSRPPVSVAWRASWKTAGDWSHAALSLTAPHHQRCRIDRGWRRTVPREVSLGHNGVPFLDELPEFQRNVLEVMRQPLEDGSVTIARAAISVTFPSRFMLAAAMNPCPCGTSAILPGNVIARPR
jgi:magnesium chelatase family protein